MLLFWGVLLAALLVRADTGDFGPTAWSCSVVGSEDDIGSEGSDSKSSDSDSTEEDVGGSPCTCYRVRDGTSLTWTKLDCSHRGFDGIEIGRELPYQVRSLNLSWNHIRFLKGGLFDRFSPLEELVVSHNGLLKIEKHALAGLTALEVLDLSHNQLTSIWEQHLTNLSALRLLDLSWNDLPYLPPHLFQHVSHLDYLSLSGNVRIGQYIHDSPDALKDVLRRGLRRLDLNHLQLIDIPQNLFSQAENLQELHIASNYFKKLPNLFIGSLQSLNISGAHISTLDTGNFLYLPSLKTLHLNRMKYLTRIEDGAFVGLKYLVELSLEKCHNLTSFSALAFGSPSSYKPHLLNFSLKHSGLQTLPKNLLPIFSTFKTLKLQGNPWDCDCRLKWFKELNFTRESDHHIRCYFPENLHNKTIFELDETDFECMTKKKRILFGTLISLAVLISLIAVLAIGAFIDTLRRKYWMNGRRTTHRIRYDPMLVQLQPSGIDWDDSDAQHQISFICDQRP